MGFWGGVREVMRSLLLFLLLAALTRCSPVSEAAAEPDPQPQPVPDPDADAHYGHWGYGRSIVLPTLWGASYGHHLHHHKRSALPEPHHGYNRYGFRGYRGWYGRKREPRTPSPSQLQDRCPNQRPMLTTDITDMVDGATPTMATAGVTTGDE